MYIFHTVLRVGEQSNGLGMAERSEGGRTHFLLLKVLRVLAEGPQNNLIT